MTHQLKRNPAMVGKKNHEYGCISCIGTDAVYAFLPSKAVGPVFEKIMRHIVDLWNNLPLDQQEQPVLSYNINLGIGQSDVSFHIEYWTREDRIVVAFPHEATAQEPDKQGIGEGTVAN